MFTTICVYCGSRNGKRPEYRAAARALGRELVMRDISLVYGGGRLGMMGQLADSVLEAGGRVFGVIPADLKIEGVYHPGLTDLTVVDSMHLRKAEMARRADGFIALPGGLGTFEEILEATTWAQLSFHDKPCGILNAAGYFDGLLRLIDHGVQEGFLKSIHRDILQIDNDPAALLERMLRYEPPHDLAIRRSEEQQK